MKTGKMPARRASSFGGPARLNGLSAAGGKVYLRWERKKPVYHRLWINIPTLPLKGKIEPL